METRQLTARENGVQNLYKYRSIDRSNIEYVKRIFTDLELYFPSPSQLNDPFECRPTFVCGNLLDHDYRQKHLSWCIRAQIHLDPNVDVKRFVEHYESISVDEHHRLTEGITEEMQRIADFRWRIYSLSTDPLNLLMWAHYAGNHSGFCLEFSTNNSLFGRAFQVKYIDELNLIDVTNDNRAAYSNALLSKTTPWSYELEYRVLGESTNSVQGLPLVVENKMIFHPNLLKSVIFGARMEAELINKVREWCSQQFREIEFKKIILNRNGSLGVKII